MLRRNSGPERTGSRSIADTSQGSQDMTATKTTAKAGATSGATDKKD